MIISSDQCALHWPEDAALKWFARAANDQRHPGRALRQRWAALDELPTVGCPITLDGYGTASKVDQFLW